VSLNRTLQEIDSNFNQQFLTVHIEHGFGVPICASQPGKAVAENAKCLHIVHWTEQACEEIS